jgi:hypothetical protein
MSIVSLDWHTTFTRIKHVILAGIVEAAAIAAGEKTK